MIPKWAARVVQQDPRGIAEDSKHARYLDVGHGPSKLHEYGGKPIDFKANCVCAKCNHGWMQRIEEAARPSVTAMIQGKHVSLSRHQQDAISAWLALKAIVERYAKSPVVPLKNEWVEYFYQNHTPPPTWQIRLTRWVGNVVVYMAGGDFSFIFRHRLTPFPVTRPGMVFTLGIGQFGAQLLGTEQQTVLSAEKDLFVTIWPHPLLRFAKTEELHDEAVQWPAKRWLNDADLEQYSRDPTFRRAKS